MTDPTLSTLVSELLPGYRLVAFDGTMATVRDEEGEETTMALSVLLMDLSQLAAHGEA